MSASFSRGFAFVGFNHMKFSMMPLRRCSTQWHLCVMYLRIAQVPDMH